MPDVRIERVYGHAAGGEAAVLVDRVWPRGIRKDSLGGARWIPEVGPSSELRAWFGHRPERWQEFRRRYRSELEAAPRRRLVDELVEQARREPLTLLYGARDTEHNQAAVLAELIREKLG